MYVEEGTIGFPDNLPVVHTNNIQQSHPVTLLETHKLVLEVFIIFSKCKLGCFFPE